MAKQQQPLHEILKATPKLVEALSKAAGSASRPKSSR